MNKNNEFFRGAIASFPMVIGFIPFALVLGTQAQTKGMTLVEIGLMTGLNFAGGSEFAVIGVWGPTLHIFLIMALTFLVNCRLIVMGAILTPYLKDLSRPKALVTLFFMCDEAWALGLADTHSAKTAGSINPFSCNYFLGCGITLHLTWVVFSILGGFIGPIIGDIEKYGFDLACPTVFLVMLLGMWKGKVAAIPWLISFVGSALTYICIDGPWYVLAGVLSGGLYAYIHAGFKLKEKR